MAPVAAPARPQIPEFRAWLTAAELLLRDMAPDDPRTISGTVTWWRRLAEYEARVLAEGEPA